MFCPKCGTNVPEGNRFCPTCGESMGAFAKEPAANDRTAMFTEEDRERTRFLAALCYLNVFFSVIGLLAEPDSKFIRYHLNQSLMLTVGVIVCSAAAIIPIIGWIVATVGGIAIFVFEIMGIVNALNKRAKDLPLTGKYTVIHYD